MNKTNIILVATAILGSWVTIGLADPNFKGPVAHGCGIVRAADEYAGHYTGINLPLVAYTTLMDCEYNF
jgi:hypothetical protein